jgi:hypothetical protein
MIDQRLLGAFLRAIEHSRQAEEQLERGEDATSHTTDPSIDLQLLREARMLQLVEAHAQERAAGRALAASLRALHLE